MSLSEDIAAAKTRGAKRELKSVIDHKITLVENALRDIGKANFTQTIDEVVIKLGEAKEVFTEMKNLVIEPEPEE